MSDIRFPRHFYQFGKGAIMTDDKINEWIQKCISNLDKSNGPYSSISSGDTKVMVVRGGEDDPEKYCIYVSRDYYKGIVYKDDVVWHPNDEV